MAGRPGLPDSVYVDGDEMIADDEVGYAVADVVVS